MCVSVDCSRAQKRHPVGANSNCVATRLASGLASLRLISADVCVTEGKDVCLMLGRYDFISKAVPDTSQKKGG